MQQYADEGIRHFYFMMLQKEEVSHQIQFSSVDADRCSTLMQRKRAGLDVSPTTLVTQIVKFRNGL